MQLDLDRVYGDAKQVAYESVLSEGPTVIKQLVNDPTSCEADWSKIRSIEVVELLRDRSRLLSERAQLDVSGESDFDEKVGLCLMCLLFADIAPAVPSGACLSSTGGQGRRVGQHDHRLVHA